MVTKSFKITRNLIQKANYLQVTQNKEVSTALSDRTLLGVLMMISFCAVAPLLDVSAKLATDEIPIGQITAIRFLIPVFLMVPLIWGLGQSFYISFQLLIQLFFRALLIMASTYCFVAAISVMPIADALAVVFIEPFILLFLGKLLFGEPVGIRRILVSVVGFLGVILVIQPSFLLFGFVALYPLGTAICFAFYMIITRKLAQEIHPIKLQFYTTLLATLVCLPALYFGNKAEISSFEIVTPEGIYWLWLFGVGFFAGISHLFITFALKYASSTVLAPLHYLEIVSAVIFGYLVFDDIPTIISMGGMVIIIVCGLYIFFREKKIINMKKIVSGS